MQSVQTPCIGHEDKRGSSVETDFPAHKFPLYCAISGLGGGAKPHFQINLNPWTGSEV